MASKKTTDADKPVRRRRFSYKWRILLPSLGAMWFLIAFLAFYQYERESTFRTKSLEAQLDMVTSNVIQAYRKDMDVVQFVDFINEYYTNTSYNGIRVSVYDYNGNLICNSGTVIPYTLHQYSNISGDDAPEEVRDVMLNDAQALEDELFYYTSQKSSDGKLCVLTAMPMTQGISSLLSRSNNIWWIIFGVALLATIVVYLFVSHLSKSVRLLTNFTEAVVNGRYFTRKSEFPRDDFGLIATKIIELYREKARALEDSERDHKIALNAIMEKSRLKREMSNNINHELKTPIGIIKGYIDTLVAQPDMEPEIRERFIARTQTNVDRLVALLNDLSIVTRLENGSKQITIGEIDFHDLMFAVADDVRMSGILNGIKLSYDIPLNCHVRGNIPLLSGVIHNLIRNASKYSQGTEIHMDFAGESDQFYRFRFYDNGVGVPPESIPKLFDRFYRVDTGRSRKLGSSGLGLAIVKSSIEALGGAISVKNRSEGGLEFTFTLQKWQSSATQQTPEDNKTEQEDVKNPENDNFE